MRPQICSGSSRPQMVGGIGHEAQIARFGFEPLVDVTGALLTVGRPGRREAVVGHIVALDAESLSNDLGGAVRIVAVDRLCQKIAHVYASLELFQQPIPAIPPSGLQQLQPS